MSVYQRLRRASFRFYTSCQKLIAPRLRDSQYHYVDKLLSIVDRGSLWLDLGCGHRIVPEWTSFDERRLSRAATLIVGVDRDIESLRRHQNVHARVVADIDALPFQEGSFNLITANMVVEHLSTPERSLKEIASLLKPGGVFLFHTVNLLHYNAFISFLLPQQVKNILVNFLESRKTEDIYPTHYRMNTYNSIQHTASKAGLETVEINMVCSSAETIMLGPIVLLELLIIRLLEHPRLEKWRSNVIAVLRQPHPTGQCPSGVGGQEVCSTELANQIECI